jgi:hypothetical protein
VKEVARVVVATQVTARRHAMDRGVVDFKVAPDRLDRSGLCFARKNA